MKQILLSLAVLMTTMISAGEKDIISLHMKLDKAAVTLLTNSGVDTINDIPAFKKNVTNTRITIIKATKEKYPIITQLNNQVSRLYKVSHADKTNNDKRQAYKNARFKLRATIVAILRNDTTFALPYSDWAMANIELENKRIEYMRIKVPQKYKEYKNNIEDLQQVRLGLLGD